MAPYLEPIEETKGKVTSDNSTSGMPLDVRCFEHTQKQEPLGQTGRLFLKQHRNRNIMLFLTNVRFKCHTQSNGQALKRNYNRVRPLICFLLSGPAQLLPLL